MKKILLMSIVTIGMMSAANANFLTDWFGDLTKVKMIKSSKGFLFKPHKVKTQYSNRIIWGADWIDHNESDPAKGIAVVVFGSGWSYTTVTDSNGNFTVRVKPASDFSIKASSGDEWCVYDGVLAGVPRGTIKVDKE